MIFRRDFVHNCFTTVRTIPRFYSTHPIQQSKISNVVDGEKIQFFKFLILELTILLLVNNNEQHTTQTHINVNIIITE